MIIYLIRNRVNGKAYVGQSTLTIEARFKQHNRDAQSGYDYALHRALRKYGKDTFEISVLCTVDGRGQADRMERVFILILRSSDSAIGYNMTYGGEGGTPNEATRRKLRESKLGSKNPNFGKPRSADACRKTSEALILNHPFRGKKLSDATRRKMSLGMKGKAKSPEHRRHIGEALRNRKNVTSGSSNTIVRFTEDESRSRVAFDGPQAKGEI